MGLRHTLTSSLGITIPGIVTGFSLFYEAGMYLRLGMILFAGKLSVGTYIGGARRAKRSTGAYPLPYSLSPKY